MTIFLFFSNRNIKINTMLLKAVLEVQKYRKMTFRCSARIGHSEANRSIGTVTLELKSYRKKNTSLSNLTNPNTQKIYVKAKVFLYFVSMNGGKKRQV